MSQLNHNVSHASHNVGYAGQYRKNVDITEKIQCKIKYIYLSEYLVYKFRNNLYVAMVRQFSIASHSVIGFFRFSKASLFLDFVFKIRGIF